MSLKEGFLIGAATAAHQVEGNNVYSDDWAMEHMKTTSFAEPSGMACDHYHRYEEDIRLLANNHLNAYRFSIEWARLEPEKGVWDENEVEHYREVIRCCKKYGITPIVTLHHFTSPKWLIEEGGWEDEKTIGYFRDYCAHVAEDLGKELEYVCTINEANMGLQVAMIAKRYRMQMEAAAKKQAAIDAKDQEGTVQVGLNMEALLARQKAVTEENLAVFGVETPQTFVSERTPEGDILVMRAHEAARDAMKAIRPHLKIGLTLSLHDVQAAPGGEKNAADAWEEEFRHYLPYITHDDFLGVQNYTRALYGPEGQLPNPPNAPLTQMGYEDYPEALAHVLRKVAEDFHGELLITENGIATADDSQRMAFIEKAFQGVEECVKDGFPIKGYMYWSLLDNFEWQKGFCMTFGLVAVNRETFERTAKPSLAYMGKIAQRA